MTPEEIQKACEALKKGHTMEGAAGEAGVSRSSLYEAMRADPAVADKVRASRARGKGHFERVLIEGLDPKLALDALKVRYKDWQQRQKVDVKADVDIKVMPKSKQEARAQLASMLAAMGEEDEED